MNEFDKIFNEQISRLDEGVLSGIAGLVKGAVKGAAKGVMAVGKALTPENDKNKKNKIPATPDEVAKAAKDAPKKWNESSIKLAETVASGINTFANDTVGRDPIKYMAAANTAKGKFISALNNAITVNFNNLQKEVAEAKKAEAATK